MVNQSATDSSLKPKIDFFKSIPSNLDLKDQKYQDDASIQARSNVQKKVLNLQVNAVLSQKQSLNGSKISESMQKGF